MKDKAFPAAIVFLISALTSASVVAAEAREEIAIDFRRESLGRATTAPSVSRPAAGTLPQALRVEVREGDLELAPEAGSADRSLATRAAIAATWTARQRFDVFGRREIYSAGFYDGLHTAMGDPSLARSDFRQGLQAGRRDREARRTGSELGLAPRESPPSAEVLGPAPPCHEVVAIRNSLLADAVPAVSEPRLFEVFDENPLDSFAEVGVQPLPDPWKLYRSESYDDFYDRDWADAAKAFEYWLSHHRDRAFWRQLEPAEHATFETLFEQVFERQLNEYSATASERAFGRGFDDGWDYGLHVGREWSYRRGYHQGFETALARHAEAGGA